MNYHLMPPTMSPTMIFVPINFTLIYKLHLIILSFSSKVAIGIFQRLTLATLNERSIDNGERSKLNYKTPAKLMAEHMAPIAA